MITPWREGGEDRLRRLVAEGLSATEIARAVGTTRCAVLGKARRLGLVLAGSTGPRVPSAAIADVQERGDPSPPRRFSWE